MWVVSNLLQQNQNAQTDTMPQSLVLIPPAIAIAVQVTCLGAVVFGCKGALKRWVAVSSLTPPNISKDNEQRVAPPPPRKGWRRVFNEQTAAMVSALVFTAAIYSVIFFVLPRIRSQRLINGLWLCLAFFLVMTTTDQALRFIFPIETLVSYIPAPSTPQRWKVKIQTPNPRPKWWYALSVAHTVVVISAFYIGVQAFLPMLACTWVFSSIASWTTHRVTMRHMVLILNGYVLFIPLLSALFAGVATLFSSGDPDGDSSSSGDNTMLAPSMWLLQIIMAYPAALPVMAPGIMLALAMRFDHSKTLALRPKASPGEAVAIPRDLEAFAKPIFNGGLHSLALCVLTLSGLSSYFGLPSGLEGAWIILTIPVTTLGMVLSAWYKGEVRDWWAYSETWMPQVDQATKAVSSDDVEARSAEWEAEASETEKLL
ncbi:hypothetical protein DB88DRAFT_501975 [Papiliotrema laurentii]|uniref:Uncharacterized protein n=1 Tax=Papiliotrema laurentii TaxID=5418 RepID=A0AAD9CSE6_PAPLA|nr:hypothetical protein DB88DRAFT_501975 [Papiliotrema laurentii]